MKSSLITADLEHCFVCGTTQNLQEHHIFYGKNRKISDKHRLTIPLCFRCHHNLHRNIELDLKIKQYAQMEFEKNFSFEEFMKLVGRNYR